MCSTHSTPSSHRCLTPTCIDALWCRLQIVWFGHRLIGRLGELIGAPTLYGNSRSPVLAQSNDLGSLDNEYAGAHAIGYVLTTRLTCPLVGPHAPLHRYHHVDGDPSAFLVIFIECWQHR